MRFDCPYCGYECEAYLAVDAGKQPKTGSLSFCYRCGDIGVFEITPLTITVRLPTPEESAEFEQESDVITARKVWQDTVKNKPKGVRARPSEVVRMTQRRKVPDD